MGFGSSKQSSQNQSQQTSNSSNRSYDTLSGSLGSTVGNVNDGTNAIRDLLGLNGGGAQTAGFDQFRNSSGYNFIQKEGLDAVKGNLSSTGNLNSGAAQKSIAEYSTGLASQFLDRYLQQLTGISNTGLGAAGVLAQAGNTSTSQGTSSGTSSGKSSNFTFG